jgi:hypothetical protein
MSDDPLDELLRKAYADDQARAAMQSVSPRVMARVRAHRRLRALLLSVAAGVGLAILLVSAGPALQALTDALMEHLNQGLALVENGRPLDSLAFALLVIVLAGGLLLASDEVA